MENKIKIKLFLFLFFISLCDGDNKTITFYEKNLMPVEMITYSDNTIVVRLMQMSNSTCAVPILTYRILYPNGTNNLINVYNHEITPFNFCIIQPPYYVTPITTFKSALNYILVMYYKQVNDDTLLAYGMVIDWSGQITSDNVFMGENISKNNINSNYLDDRNQLIYTSADNFQLNVKNFMTTDKGELIKTKDFNIQLPGPSISLHVLSTINFDTLFVFVSRNNTSRRLRNTLKPTWQIHALLLPKDSNQYDQFLIYQTSIPNLRFSNIFCGQTYDGSGFYCNFGFVNVRNVTLWVKVTFLSSGKIIEAQENTDVSFQNITFLSTYPIKSGGIIITTLDSLDNGCNVYGYLLGSNNFNISIHTDASCFIPSFDVTKNNTFLIIQEIKQNYWTLSSIDVPHILNDNGYGNPIINWTIPAINEVILTETNQLQIAYNKPVGCSSQNVSIYQKIDDTRNILCETYSGETNNCQVSPDNTTLLLKVLPSTFNRPNSVYYVKIDANFAEQNETLEPLLGISGRQWTFSTGPHHYEINYPVNAFIRLTPDGTIYFNNLSSKEKSTFSQNLLNQLAEMVPVPNNRIKFTSYKVDSSTTPLRQILISMEILESNNNSVINASTITSNLNTLINKKEFTLVSRHASTSMLDESYGLKEHRTFLELVTIPVIVIAIILFILFIIYIWAYKRCKEGRNLTIMTTAIMLNDFVFDLLFIFDVKAKNLMLLFWLSLFFTVPPIILNLCTAIYIISHENSTNSKFYEYFLKYPAIVSVFSVMSSADLEVLYILSSNFAGFNIFTAPFSNQAERYIFWFSIIGFFIEDVPQFAIRIAYQSSRVEYTIIPALSLISSSLVLLYNVVRRLHLILIRCKKISHISHENI